MRRDAVVVGGRVLQMASMAALNVESLRPSSLSPSTAGRARQEFTGGPCIELHCTALHCSALFGSALFGSALCTILLCTARRSCQPTVEYYIQYLYSSIVLTVQPRVEQCPVTGRLQDGYNVLYCMVTDSTFVILFPSSSPVFPPSPLSALHLSFSAVNVSILLHTLLFVSRTALVSRLCIHHA